MIARERHASAEPTSPVVQASASLVVRASASPVSVQASSPTSVQARKEHLHVEILKKILENHINVHSDIVQCESDFTLDQNQ